MASSGRRAAWALLAALWATPAEAGFAIEQGETTLQVGGLLQVDGLWIDGDGSDRIDRFEVRRGRVILDGRFGDVFSLRFQPQFTPGAVVVLDGYVDARIAGEALVLRVGKTKTGLGIEMLQPITSLVLPERGLSTALVPLRDLGAQLRGRAGVFEYALGVFNGAPDGSNRDGDTDDGFDLDARLAVRPWGAEVDVGAALAGGYGGEHGSEADSALGRYRTGTRAPIGRAGEGVVADGTRWRLNPQVWVYRGPFGALGEYVRSSQEVRGPGGAATVANAAWLVGASWVLTGEAARYRGIEPAGAMGAFEVMARYGELRFDEAAIDGGWLDAPRWARAWGVALAWQAHAAARVQVAFEETRFADGRPAEDAVFVRWQLAP
ncbi:MAG: hypothetical protein H6701_02505 [Myxococcales bacterium]|nr:hypothetical protein [Myxococcales bacterium]